MRWHCGLMISALVSRSGGQGSPLAGEVVFCSWPTHLTLTEPHYHHVYKRVTRECNAGGNPVMDYYPIQGGVQILLVTSCNGNQYKL